MSIVAFLLVGLIAGWIAGLVVEGHGLGVPGDIIVGIVGALIGGYAFALFGFTAYGFWGAVAMSAVGAIILLVIVGLFSGPRPLHRI